MTAHTPIHQGKSILEKNWDRMDELIDHVKGTHKGEQLPVAEARGGANELAAVILLMSIPHFTTARDVLVHANKRWKMKHEDLEWEPTPGYHYNPPPPGSQIRKTPAAPAKPRSKAEPKQLTHDQANAVKNGLMLGMEPHELAEIYQISLEQVERIKAISEM